MSNNTKGVTIWTPAFINIFIVSFALNMGQFMMNTLIPKYANYLGASATIVGMVSSMFAITALAIRPVAGPAFDYFSKKRLLNLSIAVITVAYIGYSLSSSVQMVMACRLLHGVGMGCVYPLSLAIASESLPDEKMGSGIGIYSLAQAVSSAVGPSIGLSLSGAIGYNKTFALGAVIMALAGVLSFGLKEPARTAQGKFHISVDKIIAKEALLPAFIMVFLAMSYSCINSFMAIYGAERGVSQIGLFFTVYAIFLMMSRPLSGTISDRFGLDKSIIPACLCFALSFFLISIADSLPIFLAAGAVSAFGYGACQPAIQALCMKCVPKERRGAGANTNYFGVDTGNLLGPVIAGRIAESVQASTGNAAAGYSAMYRYMIIPILIGLVLFIVNRKKLIGLGAREE
ncbi:MAG: MFS transporter [Lachnospiraceae bacterium]|nr:MFS transporter [Lachnospiraceae bacterium]